MGIRFFCPKGHKLHVKSFQAGKKGVCPDCGSRFVIPMESQRVSSKERKLMAAQGDTAAKASSVGVALEKASTNKAVAEAIDDDAEPVEIQIADDGQDEVTSSTPLPPVPAVSPKAASGSSDPIAEAPDAVWYVRPSAGGQYGPARGEIMRRWIAEGRVGTDSLVWREGWNDWKSASSVFPEVAKQVVTAAAAPAISTALPNSSAPVIATNSATAASNFAVPLAANADPISPDRPAAKSRSSHAMTIWVVVGLSLVAVALGIALIYVLRRG